MLQLYRAFVPFNFPSITLLPQRQTWSVSIADKATVPCKNTVNKKILLLNENVNFIYKKGRLLFVLVPEQVKNIVLAIFYGFLGKREAAAHSLLDVWHK